MSWYYGLQFRVFSWAVTNISEETADPIFKVSRNPQKKWSQSEFPLLDLH
jgi:hypothetical protein